ncbi:hypothetical protein J8M20_07170 [Pseudoalteromonas luteoviolacea]|uniref:hypothetical protein n=1 Tax=Pseudoalteromonas luteoviolacea TaxID=43657 RepID=UPI001B366EFF|nr:hypothetical protein [Pseudoalteromonas luteoviolacea]MBQ4811110.1 hypothetical protein [Pseudoalteromonas luteoviolacea]
MRNRNWKRNRNKRQAKPDNFARIASVISLIIASIAVGVPIWQANENDKERLNLWMRTNPDGIIRLPKNRETSQVVQVPWIFTLSNTGKVKLSITGYRVHMVNNVGLSFFSNLADEAKNLDGSKLVTPFTLDAGESKSIKINLGFKAKEVVLDHLYTQLNKVGPFTLDDSFMTLAEHGLTIYGGEADYKVIEGSTLITMTKEFYKSEPTYRVEFITGRNESFFIQGSETSSKFIM